MRLALLLVVTPFVGVLPGKLGAGHVYKDGDSGLASRKSKYSSVVISLRDGPFGSSVRFFTEQN